MLLYTFLITSNDSEDFKAELTAHQNIKLSEVHLAIQKALGYDPLEMSSFYICDSEWQKQREIAMIDMGDGADVDLMEDVVLGDIVKGDEQNILYLYDFFSERNFFMMLDKVSESSEKTFSIDVFGTIPPQILIDSDGVDDLLLEMGADQTMEEEDDMDFPNDSVSLEDLDNIEDY